MKKIEILSGDIEQGKWEISDRKLRKGKYVIKEVPFRDIVSITKEEQIGRKSHIKVDLGSGQSFKAVVGNSAFNELYSYFSKYGNQPINQQLPLSRYSKSELFFLGIIGILGGMFVVGQFINDGTTAQSSSSSRSYSSSSSESSSTTPPAEDNFDMTTLSSATKVNVCKEFIGRYFGRPPSIIEHVRTDDSGNIYVSYVREDDGTVWDNVCSIDKNTIIWAGWKKFEEEWGRWRNEDRTTLSLSSEGDAVVFTPPHYDESEVFEVPRVN